MPWWTWVPLTFVLVLTLLLGTFVLLARIKGGKYLKPLVIQMSKIPMFKRMFTNASLKAYERTNPELAAAMRKMTTFGEPKNPEQAQRMLNMLTPSERRAYMTLVGEEGAMPEPTNRQQRRRMEHGGQGMPTKSAAASTRPGAAGRKPKPQKKKR